MILGSPDVHDFESTMMMMMTWEAAQAQAIILPPLTQGANLNRMRDFDPRFPSQR